MSNNELLEQFDTVSRLARMIVPERRVPPGTGSNPIMPTVSICEQTRATLITRTAACDVDRRGKLSHIGTMPARLVIVKNRRNIDVFEVPPEHLSACWLKPKHSCGWMP